MDSSKPNFRNFPCSGNSGASSDRAFAAAGSGRAAFPWQRADSSEPGLGGAFGSSRAGIVRHSPAHGDYGAAD